MLKAGEKGTRAKTVSIPAFAIRGRGRLCQDAELANKKKTTRAEPGGGLKEIACGEKRGKRTEGFRSLRNIDVLQVVQKAALTASQSRGEEALLKKNPGRKRKLQ